MSRSRSALLVVVLLVLAGCGSSGPSAVTVAPKAATTLAATADSTGPQTSAPVSEPTPGAVVKDVLGTDVDPPGAPGRTLTLIRYTIPPAAKLAPHIHPGVQLASIQSGTLSYTVISGTASVKRAVGPTEELTGPTDAKLHAGDAVTEVDGMVHFGANDTTEPVVIMATLLTEDGKDLAILVPQPNG